MKVFITGSTGFVGRYVANKLSKIHSLILPVRNFEKAKKILEINENIKLIPFKEELDKIVVSEKPDVIINFLGEFINDFPISYDQWLMLEKDNICNGKYPGVKSLINHMRDPFDLNY